MTVKIKLKHVEHPRVFWNVDSITQDKNTGDITLYIFDQIFPTFLNKIEIEKIKVLP